MLIKITDKLSNRSDAFILLMRITLGVIFVFSGWGKFNNFDGTVGFFTAINIPFPVVNTFLVAAIELIVGILIVLGFYMRVAIIPLAVVMGVATLTHLHEVNQFVDFLKITAWGYLNILLVLLGTGSGKWSLDSVIKR